MQKKVQQRIIIWHSAVFGRLSVKFLLSVSQLNAVRLLWISIELHGITLKLQKFRYAVFQSHLLALGKLVKKECSWCRPSHAARLKSFLPSLGARPVHLMLQFINVIDFSGDSFIRINNNRGAPRLTYSSKPIRSEPWSPSWGQSTRLLASILHYEAASLMRPTKLWAQWTKTLSPSHLLSLPFTVLTKSRMTTQGKKK